MNGIVEMVTDNTCHNVVSNEDLQLDLYLKIHDKVNAKSEEISKSYNENILVNFNDIKELHFKTLQSIKSLSPAKNNLGVRISVSHNEGESEKFNSFEEFEKHNITSPNPTSNISMIYTFTLYDKGTEEFENYKVINKIRSRIADLQQLEKEAPAFISSAIISSMVTTTAQITIHYSDYVKARHFTAMFDEWIKSCDESNSVAFIHKMKKVSHLITRFGKLCIYALLAVCTSSALNIHAIDSDSILKFLVVYASVFVIVGEVAAIFLSKIELSIDSYLSVSYLNLNKGDVKLIRDFSNRNRKSIMWAVAGIVGAVSTGIFTNYTYDLIKVVLS